MEDKKLEHKKEMCTIPVKENQIFTLPIKAIKFDRENSIISRCDLCVLRHSPYCLLMDCVIIDKEKNNTKEKYESFYFQIII